MAIFSIFSKSLFNRYLLLIGFIFLSGCSSQMNVNQPLTAKTKIDSQQGVVVVRVINTSSYPLPFNYLTIAPKNLNESKKVKFERLVSLKTHTTDSNIFSSAIKAGSYSLSSISSFHQKGDYYYSRGTGADIKFGTFEVEPGKITDLGTIIYYPKPQDDKYVNTLTRLEDTQPVEVLNKFFPFYNYDKNQVLTWNEDELDEERESVYVSIAQNPVTFNHKYAAPDGSVYFIGKLGVILKRSASGEWDIDAVDSNVDLNTIKQNLAGDLIVAGNEGAVFLKKFDGEWQDVSLATNSNIKQIEVNDNGRVELMSFQTKTAEIYRANLTDNTPNWRLMASYTSLSGWKDGAGNTQQISVLSKEEKKKAKNKRKIRQIFNVQTHHLNDKHVVSITYGRNHDLAAFGDGVSKDYTFDPETWEIQAIEHSAQLTRTLQAGQAKVAIEQAGYWSWTGMPSIYTVDENGMRKNELSTAIKSCKAGYTLGKKLCFKGKNHEKIKKESFKFVSIPWFLNDLEALSIVSFRHYNFFTGPAKTEYKILKTTDGGNNWVKTELKLPNEYCMDIVAEVKDKILLSCDGVSGDFYESADFGETWQHVRQHENF
ncbi:hypothetical protein [Thalassotalea sp. ND16A]|uniref:hypothetical protein n=1 Tax=Thalassotalea sp. ND16A TaxID=1535422 RepID=UPI00051A4223|nr:hypothetical protein [Thalassotalea sp. ND16A]KGJ89476.1 hypothetical protein ND16A_2369 [Thalassotalea sp. ND16A]